MILRKILIEKKLLRRQNSTTSFFLPTYGTPINLFSNSFIGMYIKDLKTPILSFVFENNSEDEGLRTIIHLLNLHNLFHSADYDGNAEEIVIDMKLDKDYHKDFNLFLQGKYSELSDDLKYLLMKTYGKKQGVGRFVTMYETIKPTDQRRRDLADDLKVDYNIVPFEILDLPNMDYEQYLTIQQLKEKYNYGTEQSNFITDNSI